MFPHEGQRGGSLLLLHALLQSSAEISLSLEENSHINHWPFYHRWCRGWMKSNLFPLEVKRHSVKYKEHAWLVTSSTPTQTTQWVFLRWNPAFPYGKKMPQGCDNLNTQDPTAFHCFGTITHNLSCNSVPVLFTLLKRWVCGFLSHKTGE